MLNSVIKPGCRSVKGLEIVETAYPCRRVGEQVVSTFMRGIQRRRTSDVVGMPAGETLWLRTKRERLEIAPEMPEKAFG